MTLTVLVLSDGAGDVTQLLPAWPMGGYGVVISGLKDIAVKDLIETHPDMVLVDGTGDLRVAEEAARRLSLAWEIGLPPVIVVLDEASLQSFRLESGADDFLMVEASSGEISTRLSMALHRSGRGDEPVVLKVGDLTVNPDNYQTYLRGRPLDLTYKEFELLKFLAQRPGRVCNRDLLLQEVWGYDYYGGTRTVDSAAMPAARRWHRLGPVGTNPGSRRSCSPPCR